MCIRDSIRLDEALDFRHEINVEGHQFKAAPGWFVVASINPLDRYHPGTKELPGQLLSRFPVRIHMDYPDPSTEYKIVKLHVPAVSKIADQFIKVLILIEQMRKTDLPYTPSIRESIAIAKLLTSGINLRVSLEMVLVDVYAQFGSIVMEQVKELIHSRLGVSFR